MQGVEKMSKRAYIFYLLILVTGFVVAYISGMKLGNNKEIVSYNTENNYLNTNSDTDTEKIDGYWIIAVNNKINVYKNDKKTIMAETDIDIREFSETEKNMLSNGIYYEKAEELFKYLESKTS